MTEQQKINEFLILLKDLAHKHNIYHTSEMNSYFKLKKDLKIGYDISETKHPFIDDAIKLFYEHFRQE